MTGVAAERDLVRAGSDADSVLARRAAEGDQLAFQTLFERYHRPMAALVSRMIANSEDVDDVLQEVFVRAWRGLPNFRGDAQFSTWLYRIAVNSALKYRSKTRRDGKPDLSTEDLAGGVDQLAADEDAPAVRGGDPLQETVRQDRDEQVRAAVANLPEKQRSVVVLHYFEGHSCDEISKMVGCTVGTVWSRLHYACKRLKGVLGEGF